MYARAVNGVCMYECEICGKKADTVYRIMIDSAEMLVCRSCASGKKVLQELSESKPAQATREKKRADSADEVIADYGGEIRKARERMNIPINVLAEMLNEKESTLHRVENGKMLPSIGLTAKLEKELGIKLTSKTDEKANAEMHGKEEPITLGDAAVQKKKENGR